MKALDFFYLIKPAIPRGLQICLRRVIAAQKRQRSRAVWPIDPAAAKPPRDWAGWPEGKRRGFWARVRELGLSDDVVHVGFGCETMKEYQGSVDDARVILAALDYAIKATIGVAGLSEALGMPVAKAVADGADMAVIKDAVDAYIAEKVTA